MFLPLTNNPEETFRSSISGLVYNFRQLWNEYGFWTLDILDADVVLVYGVKLVTQENILRQYPQVPFDLLSASEADPGRYELSSFNLEVVIKNV